MLCISGFRDDFIFSHNEPGNDDSNREYTQNDSPGGAPEAKSDMYNCIVERLNVNCATYFPAYSLLRSYIVITNERGSGRCRFNEQICRTELVADQRTALDRRETEKKSVALDTFRFQSRRTPLIRTQLL